MSNANKAEDSLASFMRAVEKDREQAGKATESFRGVTIEDFRLPQKTTIPERKNRNTLKADFCPGSREWEREQQAKAKLEKSEK